MHPCVEVGQLRWLLKLALTCYALLSAAPSTWAKAAGAPEFLLDVWTQDDGAPGNTVTGFAQGPDGYLWIVSDQALARFDGVRFVEAQSEQLAPRASEWEGPLRYARRLVGAPSAGVWLATGDGDLWRWTGREFESWFPPNTTTHGYLQVFQGRDNHVIAVTRSGRFLRGGKNGVRHVADVGSEGLLLADALCHDLAGGVWFATESGKVGRVDSAGRLTWASAGPAGASARALAGDDRGTIWVGTDRGLRVGMAGRFVDVPSPNPDQPFSVRCIMPARDGALWVSSAGKAWHLAEGKWRGPLGDWPGSVPAQARAVDHSGRLWLAAPTQGLRCITLEGATVQLGPENGLTADATSLFCDQEGDLWASVYRTGIARIRERRFTAVRLADGLHAAPVWNVAEDGGGTVWLSAEFIGPVRWLKGADTEPARVAQGINPAGWTKALAVDRLGRAAAAVTGMGIVCFEQGAFRPVAPWPADAGFARVIYQDSASRWWMGTDSGLQCWSGGRWQSWGAADGLPAKPIRAIAEDAQGRIWVGTYGGGLARWEGKRFVAFTRQGGLADDAVYALCPGADGSLWIGTHGGLARWQSGRFSRFGIENGLPDNRVVQVLEDGRGSVWAGTRDGLCRIALDSFDAVTKRERTLLDCVVFGKDDGLPTRVFQDRASPGCWRTRDGQLWFLTATGAVYCQPGLMPRDHVPPPVQIEQVLVDGRSYSETSLVEPLPGPGASAFGALALRAPERIELTPGGHVLEIIYTSPSLPVPDKVAFEYQMVGWDAQWLSANGRRSAIYGLLPPGQYRFQVRARNHDGLWNEPKASLRVLVHPSLWQRAWFGPVAGASLAFSGGAALTWLQRARLRRQMARLKVQRAQDGERQRISRDLHDHLGASLTEIGMLAEDGACTVAAPAAALDGYRVIKQRINAAVGDLDALVWAVDPKQDTLTSLAGYLASFVEEYASVSGLNCRINLARPLPNCTVSSELRHHLFLAVKEAVHNIVRHARARGIAFEFQLAEGSLQIVVADDGEGFDPQTARGGNGLGNLRERLASAGGRCEISSRKGEGATVRLSWPLPG